MSSFNIYLTKNQILLDDRILYKDCISYNHIEMSYFTDFQDPESIKNLLLKKEFASFKKRQDDRKDGNDRRYINKLIMDPYIIREGNLVLHAHQKFVGNWMHPDTPFSRILAKHSTGSGKTLLALNIANNFIKHFQNRFNFSDKGYAPTVYIVGFVRHNFQKELMTRPEFGFVSKQDVEEYKRLKFLANTGSKKDRDILVDFESKIKKRFSKRTRGGFYKFLGYKELFNKLFIFENKSGGAPDEDVEQAERTEDVERMEDDIQAGTNIVSMLRGLKDGSIKINMEFLDTFANSLLICDEIHNTYNSININNYGTAIQVILDIYDAPEKMNRIVNLSGKTAYGFDRMSVLRNSLIRALYMSATPINNSPTEIVDLLNLLIPWTNLPEGKKLTKEMFFTDNNLKPGALQKIGQISRGYISFLRDENPKLYPKKIYSGDIIQLPKKYLAERVKWSNDKFIPYLKFIRCPISPYHYKTYKAVYSGSLPPDGQTLVDMVIPNPGLGDTDKSIGLFRSRDIKYGLTNASQSWKDKNKISMIKQSISGSSSAYIISGEFWNAKNIAQYSSKYAELIKEVHHNLRFDEGKIIISHQYVKLSGVLGLQELLRRNGVIDENSSPSSNTLCSICGKPMSDHGSSKGSGGSGKHAFKPARFITLYGELEKSLMDRNIDKFNSPDNVEGYNYRIIIGSAVLNEALDFSAVRNLWVVSAPPDISSLIQIIGRGYRSGSALLIPPEKRTLTIKIFVSSLPKNKWKDDLFYEEKKYFDKTQMYLIIQQIDEELNKNAVDTPINYDRIFRNDGNVKKDEFAQLGPLHYNVPDVFTNYWMQVANGKRDIRVDDLRTETFNVWHEHDELYDILFIIKRLFLEQSSVWAYGDLWQLVRNPPFPISVNTHLFSEDNFKFALHILSDTESVDAYSILMKSSSRGVSHNAIDRLFNHLDRRVVFPSGDEAQIKYLSGYYILFPVKSSDILDEGKTQLGLESIDLLGYPDVDIDSWYRHDDDYSKTVLNITKLLKTSQMSYSQMKYKFYKSFRNVPIQGMPISVEIYDSAFHKRLLEDSIRYAFNVLVDRNFPVSELHDFYFKMIYFYDHLEMILFASHIQDVHGKDKKNKLEAYKPYVTKPNPKINPYQLTLEEDGKMDGKIKDKQYNAFLITSIAKSSLPEKLDFDRLNEFISKEKDIGVTAKSRKPGFAADVGVVSAELRPNIGSTSKRKIIPVPSNMLPVGHFLNLDSTEIVVPYLYMPEEDEWRKAPEFVRAMEVSEEKEVENDILVGYYEKVVGGIDVKFKTRAPIQKIVKHSDTRMIESGAACDNKRKEEIIELLNTVGVKDVRESRERYENMNIRELCEMLKLELMKRELLSRRNARHGKGLVNGKRVRWFYMHFEKQPSI